MKIYGTNPIYEALKAGRQFETIFIDVNKKDKFGGIISTASEKKVRVEYTNSGFIDKTFGGTNQGIGAYVAEYKYKTIEEVIDKDKIQSFIILDGLEDPHNLGALIRTAEASGMDGIIIPKNRSVSLNSTVVKVSTGAIEYVNLIEVNNLNNTIKLLKDNGFWIIGTDASPDKSYKDIDHSTSVAVVIGSEGKGMSKLVKQNCDYLVSIPMMGKVNSLNASVSASIIMYELLNKKKQLNRS